METFKRLNISHGINFRFAQFSKGSTAGFTFYDNCSRNKRVYLRAGAVEGPSAYERKIKN